MFGITCEYWTGVLGYERKKHAAIAAVGFFFLYLGPIFTCFPALFHSHFKIILYIPFFSESTVSLSEVTKPTSRPGSPSVKGEEDKARFVPERGDSESELEGGMRPTLCHALFDFKPQGENQIPLLKGETSLKWGETRMILFLSNVYSLRTCVAGLFH